MIENETEVQEEVIEPPATFESTKPGAGQTARGAILNRTQRHPRPNNMGIPAGTKIPAILPGQ